MQSNLPPSNCRCDALREHFGALAPTCSVCTREQVVRELVEAGFTSVPRAWLLPLQDCGVAVRTGGGREEQAVWCPHWAAVVVEAMNPHSGFCGPILRRGAEDETFQQAVEAICRLTGKPSHVDEGGERRGAGRFWLEAVCTKLEAFAVAEGLTPLPPVA